MPITLHEEIVAVLRRCGHSLTSTEIADSVNKRRQYQRTDGMPVPASQIRARANNNHRLFVLNGSTIELRSRSSIKKGDSDTVTNPRKPQNHKSKSTSDLPPCVSTIDELRTAGFIELGLLSDLLSSKVPDSDSLSKCGVYAISTPRNYKPKFRSSEETGRLGNVVNPWDVSRLRQKWVGGVDVIYIGLAGKSQPRSLRKRLIDLLRHGNGQTTSSGPHKGGEILWQLIDYESFTLWAIPTTDPPTPRNTEKHLILEFERRMGQLPFANRQR